MVNNHQVPLSNGLFVEAIIEGLPLPQLLVPEATLHGNTLYTLNEQSKLQKVNVDVLFRRDGLAAVDGAVQAGDSVVTTDLIPAIDGMQLKLAAGNSTKDTHKEAETSQ